MRTDFETLLKSEQPVTADGGMGTMLFGAGLARGQAPELWNAERPEEVRKIHAAYIAAGAQIILTNTFGGNRVRLDTHHLASRTAELNTRAAELARAEADAAPAPVLVAGSMGPTGSILEPLGDLSFDRAVEVFEEQARALVAGGVDAFWIETMSDPEEVRAAVAGCRCATADLPIIATLTFDTRGRTMMGISPEQAVNALEAMELAAFGANCGNGPLEIEAVIEKMHQAAPNAVLVAKSNAGLPHMVNGIAVYDAGPQEMARYAQAAHGLGARIVGACCGSTPEHVQAIATVLGGKLT